MNPLTKDLVKPVILALLICGLSIYAFSSAYATPPTPPVQLQLPKAEELAALQPSEGAFTVSARVLAHQDVRKLTLIVRMTRMGTVGRPEGQIQNYALEGLTKDEAQAVEVKIPVQDKDGLFRIEAALQIELKGQTGVVSKEVLIQVVEKGRPRLTTPVELRRTQVLQKQQAFQEALAKKPEQPDIRLLMDSMVPVPPDLEKHIKPYRGPKHERAKGSGPPNMLEPYLIDKTKNDKPTDSHLWQKPGVVLAQFIPLIELRGQVVFEDWYTNTPCNPFDPNDPYYPCTPGPPAVLTGLANATIVIYLDNVGGFDAGLDITETDENGFWSVYLDPALAGSHVYYTVSLNNESFNVGDDAGNDYIWRSATRFGVGGVVNFGQETFTTNVEAAQVFSTINRGWNHIATEGGQDPGFIGVQYPDFCGLSDGTVSSCWDPSAEVVRLKAETNTGPDIILHEYGHALLHYAFGFSPGGGPHSFTDLEQDSGVAFNEGWATGFALSVCPDGALQWSEWRYQDPSGGWPFCTAVNGGFGQFIEGFDIQSQNRKGERHEGRVAAAITDFLDAPNDNNSGNENQGKNGYEDANENDRISLATIYRDSMWGFSFGDFINYFIQLRTNLTSTMQALADDIMTYNWMSWPITVPVPETVCVASKVAMAMSPDYAVTLDGLRAFRDQVMKPLMDGRRWIQSYYSHSPEMAILLIGDSEARKAGQVIVEHFSQVGRTLKKSKGLERLSESQEAVLPPPVIEAIKKISKTINAKGSEELKQKLTEAREFLKSFQDMSMSQAVRQVSAMEKAGRGKGVPRVQPMKFAPGSQHVDWELIKKNLPKGEWPGTRGKKK